MTYQMSVMYITGEFILKGTDQTWQKPFTSMINLLPPGNQIPVYRLIRCTIPIPLPGNTINSFCHQASSFKSWREDSRSWIRK